MRPKIRNYLKNARILSMARCPPCPKNTKETRQVEKQKRKEKRQNWKNWLAFVPDNKTLYSYLRLKNLWKVWKFYRNLLRFLWNIDLTLNISNIFSKINRKMKIPINVLKILIFFLEMIWHVGFLIYFGYTTVNLK